MYDPTARKWSLAGSLSLPRAEHTATLLDNGKVLVAGGYTRGPYSNQVTYTKAAELFDPVTGLWTPTGSLNAPHDGHTATLLANGEVLLAGGYTMGHPNENSPAEIYDPVGETWRSTANLNTGRSGHTATLLASGNVLVVGGNLGILDSAELYEYPHALSPGAIGSGFTGFWYNPAQPGHGFAVEVLPGTPMQMLASWMVFAPQGGQSWIVGLGPISGNQAVLQGSQAVGSGARFPPNFDSANVHTQAWGSLTFTFSDCNHGHVDWAATSPGYGSGGTDITRLTLPAGLTCSATAADGFQ
jgi:hypothetical protein